MATLKERIDADLKDAMRAKNELTTSRAADAQERREVQGSGARRQGPLDDAGDHARSSPPSSSSAATRSSSSSPAAAPELAEKEEEEIAVLQNYLPKQLTADELRAEVADGDRRGRRQGPKDMGAVMKVARCRSCRARPRARPSPRK